jgi:hypothetical protein
MTRQLNERLDLLRCRAVLNRVNLHNMTDELTDLDGQPPVEQALAGGEPQRVSWFRFYFVDERWEWSAQIRSHLRRVFHPAPDSRQPS